MKPHVIEKLKSWSAANRDSLRLLSISSLSGGLFTALQDLKAKPAKQLKPDAELKMVAEICADLGCSPVPGVEYVIERDPFYAAAGPKPDSEGEILYQINISPAVLPVLGEAATRGVLAHEIAHIVRQDSLNRAAFSRDSEAACDLMAAAHGYGPGLEEALSDTNEDPEEERDSETPSALRDHPPLTERLAMLRRYSQPKAA
jgi:Zn-dependent protease with chaperone function